MKRLTVKFAALAILATFSLPAMAQEEKEKSKTDKKETEQITIILKGDKKEKVTVEILGDKVTVNGKPAEDLKDDDIKVLRNKFKTFEGLTAFGAPRSGGRAWNFEWDGQDGMGLFGSGNENRAMLGVVTEGNDQGAEVNEVTKESAAEKAGLKEGDIITKIGDAKISDADDLTDAIKKHKPGDKVTVTFLRDKKEQKVTAELGKWKGVSAFSYAPGQQFKMDMPTYEIPRVFSTPRDYFGQNNIYWSGSSPRLGLSVQDTDDGKGVKVIEVDEESNAAKAGVKENDIITHFNDKEVNSADEIAKMTRESKDKASIQLKIKRDGKMQNIDVKMPRKLKTADL